MQLLHSTSLGLAEFVSLSVTIKFDNDNNDILASLVDPLIIASPYAIVSSSEVSDALQELHNHIKSSASRHHYHHAQQFGAIATEILRQEQQHQHKQNVQTFRPLSAAGVSLQYSIITNDASIKKIAPLVLPSITGLANITSVILSVGSTGFGQLHYNKSSMLSQSNFVDCVTLLTRMGTTDPAASKALLATFFLSDTEERQTNEMAQASMLTFIPETDADIENKMPMGKNNNNNNSNNNNNPLLSPMGIISPMQIITPIGSVLGSTMPRKRRSTIVRASAANDDDDDNINLTTAVTIGVPSHEAARTLAEKLTVLSMAETDVYLRKYETTLVERLQRQSMLTINTSSKISSRRSKKLEKDPDFDHFDYKGLSKEALQSSSSVSIKTKTAAASPMSFADFDSGSVSNKSAKIALKKKDTGAYGSSRKKQQQHGNDEASFMSSGGHQSLSNFSQAAPAYDPFSATTHTSTSTATSSSRRKAASRDDDISHHSVSHNSTIAASSTHIQVNIALNEDLVCSYKQSQLSSCNVEGVIQIQIKSSVQGEAPFFLLIQDVSNQIESLTANGKFADDVSDALMRDHEQDIADRKFTVTLPRADSYFPVLRYKCVDELRPVPIRVQTRVKVENGQCRVALQISSNPNNEAALSDLTIIMGVPEEVRGESLVTQPAGGVWNESKRSVIWVVSELGEGEKFQLQSRFVMHNNNNNASDEKPNFPVLVRCQCLFAQLSNVELTVRDIPDMFPAEISMKVARRFRLSHRER